MAIQGGGGGGYHGGGGGGYQGGGGGGYHGGGCRRWCGRHCCSYADEAVDTEENSKLSSAQLTCRTLIYSGFGTNDMFG